jgi:hypothetical protein
MICSTSQHPSDHKTKAEHGTTAARLEPPDLDPSLVNAQIFHYHGGRRAGKTNEEVLISLTSGPQILSWGSQNRQPDSNGETMVPRGD